MATPKVLFILILFILFQSCSNQNQSGSSGSHDKPKFNKDSFAVKCIASAKKDIKFKSVDIVKYCNCLAEKIEQNQHDSVLLHLFAGLDNTASLVSQMEYLYDNPKMKGFFNECVFASMDRNSNEKIQASTEEERQALIRQFKIGLTQQEGYAELTELVNIDAFCECFVDKFIKQFTYSEIMSPDFANNPEKDKIMQDCLLKNKK